MLLLGGAPVSTLKGGLPACCRRLLPACPADARLPASAACLPTELFASSMCTCLRCDKAAVKHQSLPTHSPLCTLQYMTQRSRWGRIERVLQLWNQRQVDRIVPLLCSMQASTEQAAAAASRATAATDPAWRRQDATAAPQAVAAPAQQAAATWAADLAMAHPKGPAAPARGLRWL